MFLVRNVLFDDSIVPSDTFSYFSNLVFHVMDPCLHVIRGSVEHFQGVRGAGKLLYAWTQVADGCCLRFRLLRFLLS